MRVSHVDISEFQVSQRVLWQFCADESCAIALFWDYQGREDDGEEFLFYCETCGYEAHFCTDHRAAMKDCPVCEQEEAAGDGVAGEERYSHLFCATCVCEPEAKRPKE